MTRTYVVWELILDAIRVRQKKNVFFFLFGEVTLIVTQNLRIILKNLTNIPKYVQTWKLSSKTKLFSQYVCYAGENTKFLPGTRGFSSSLLSRMWPSNAHLRPLLQGSHFKMKRLETLNKVCQSESIHPTQDSLIISAVMSASKISRFTARKRKACFCPPLPEIKRHMSSNYLEFMIYY